jgi:hypothetical protein
MDDDLLASKNKQRSPAEKIKLRDPELAYLS